MESINQRLDRVLDHVTDLKAKAEKIVLSSDDWKELGGSDDQQANYRDVPLLRGEIGQSSYVATSGGPNGDVNFGV